MTAPASMIPYVDDHTGPSRVLTLHLMRKSKIAGPVPFVGIDGRQYLVYWGSVQFEIPADRPCHVSVYAMSDRAVAPASALVPSGGPVVLTYDFQEVVPFGAPKGTLR